MKQLGPAIVGPSGKVLPLSAGVEVGGFIYLSGQLAMNDGKILDGGITAQTEQVFDNIEALLATAGATLADVFKATVWLTAASDFADFNAVYASRFKAPYPVRSTVICALVAPEALVEIEVVATKPGS
ncbi:RidA family protein [Glacieibacterium sp.]|uniref:RidA family protein n=1 Tax=Glacieibacterium sp. TaxID=2860237 RepID=UPI003AFF8842